MKKYQKPNARDLSLVSAEGACSSGFAVGPCTGGGSAGDVCTNGWTANNGCGNGSTIAPFTPECATGGTAVNCLSTGVTAQ